MGCRVSLCRRPCPRSPLRARLNAYRRRSAGLLSVPPAGSWAWFGCGRCFRLRSRIRCSGPKPEPAESSHLLAASTSAQELIAAIGIEPRHTRLRRHWSFSRTSPVRGSFVAFADAVPELALVQVTPVTKRLDSIVRRIAPICGSLDGSSGRGSARPKTSLRPMPYPNRRRPQELGLWCAREADGLGDALVHNHRQLRRGLRRRRMARP